MTNIPYDSKKFDCVFDVFSSCLLAKEDGNIFLKEVNRVLKKGGKFFSYFPSKNSKMFKSKNKTMYDQDTIIKLRDENPIFKIDNTPMRFLYKSQYIKMLRAHNIFTYYDEELSKTYFHGKDQFTFIVLEAQKK